MGTSDPVYTDLTNPEYVNNPAFQAARAQLGVNAYGQMDNAATAAKHQGFWSMLGDVIGLHGFSGQTRVLTQNIIPGAIGGIEQTGKDLYGFGKNVAEQIYHNPLRGVMDYTNPLYGLQDTLINGQLSTSGGINWTPPRSTTSVKQNAMGLANQSGALVMSVPHAFTGFANDWERNGAAFAVSHFGSSLAPAFLLGPEAGVAGEVSDRAAYEAAVASTNIADKQFLDGVMNRGVDKPLASANPSAPNSLLDQVNLSLDRLRLVDPKYYDQILTKLYENSAVPVEQNIYNEAAQRIADDNYGQTETSLWRDKVAEFKSLQRSAAQKAGSLIGGPVKALRVTNSILNDPRFITGTVMYLESLSPQERAQAESGIVIMPDGSKKALRDVFADALGAHKGFFHDFIATSFNIDMNLTNDAAGHVIGQVFKPVKATRAFFGKYSEVADKMGWHTSGSLTSDYYSKGAVRRAIDFMASHTGAEIAYQFDGMFGNSFNRGVLRELSLANTPQEVLRILEDEVAGRELARSVVPRMGWYDVFKASLRGELAAKFGVLGNILAREIEINDQLAIEVEAQTGYDIRPKTSAYLKLNEAGRARVLLRKRLVQKFVKTPMWLDKATGKMTNRILNVNDINSVPSLMRWLEYLGMSYDTSVSWGNAIIEKAGDPRAYKLAVRNLVRETIMRPLYAVATAAEHEHILVMLEQHIEDLSNRLIGNDAGGAGGVTVAGDIEWSKTAQPRGDMVSAAGSTQLGTVTLPKAQDIVRLQKFFSELFLQVGGSQSGRDMLETGTKLIDAINLANFSTDTIDDLLIHLKSVRADRMKPSAMWESPEINQAWGSKSQEVIARMEKLTADLNNLDITRAERVGRFLVDIENQTGELRQIISGVQSDMEQRLGAPLLSHTQMIDQIINGKGMLSVSESEYRAFMRLHGELTALEEMMVETKARLNNSPTSYDNIKQLAHDVAKMTEQRDEKAKLFEKELLKRWSEGGVRKDGLIVRRLLGTDRQVWGKAGARAQGIVGTVLPRTAKLLGKYEYRNNAHVLTDMAQSFLDDWFKPQVLSSPAWATRVSLSESMLNSFRIGGDNWLESTLSRSIAKHLYRLGEAIDSKEIGLLRHSVGNMLLGFEEGLLKSLSGEQRQRLVDDALQLFIDHKGHLPYGIHGSHDAMTRENMENEALMQVYGVGKDGKVAVSSAHLDDTFDHKGATAPDIGSSMHEAVKRAGDDYIFRMGAEFLDNEAKIIGQRILAENPQFYGEAVSRAVEELRSDVNGLFQRRTDVINKLLEEVSKYTYWSKMNAAERQALTEEILKRAVSPEDVVSELIPRSYRNTFDVATRRIANLEAETIQIERRISERNKTINELRDILANSPSITADMIKTADDSYKQAETELEDLARQIKEMDRLISDHPYHESYTVLDKGAALDRTYGETLDNFRETLRGNVKDWAENANARLRELLGDKPVVLPRQGYAEMSGKRMFVFLDDKGNPVENGERYAQMMDAHPELWSDNHLFKNYLPFGMPGVHGVGAMDRAIDSGIPFQQWFDEVKRTINYANTLDQALARMDRGEWAKAWQPLTQVNMADMETIRSLREDPLLLPQTYSPDSVYSIKGVPGDLILGVGRNKDRTLADLALHMRQNNTLDVSRIFDKRFIPNYSLNDADRVRFSNDFAKYQRILKLKNPTSQEQKEAIRWFGKYVSYNQDEWETTAKKVWDRNVDLERGKVARKLNRDDYYSLIERRRELNAARSRSGLKKRNALDAIVKASSISGDDATAPVQKRLDRELKALGSLQDRRREIDVNLTFEHARRDDIAEHVATQQAKDLGRQLDKATDAYITRARKASKGIGLTVRRVESRTATINRQIEKAAQKHLDDILAEKSRQELAANLGDIRSRAEQHVQAQLQAMPPEDLARYDRSIYPLADERLSTGDPMMDWAKTVVQHVSHLGVGSRGTVYPEIWKEMVTKDVRSARKYAEWFASASKLKEDRPTQIPARRTVSPFAKGVMSGLMSKASTALQGKVLAPIVNEISREPLYVWEYHQQMERLRNFVSEGVINEDMARQMAGEEAIIRMSKFVHEPLEKTWWEYNMRLLAPFYFAKNQAWRRASRAFADNPAGIYKYMRNMMSLTNLASAALNPSNGQKGYTFPGAAAVVAIGSAPLEVMYALHGQNISQGLKNLSFQLSPTAANSVLLTGSTPGMAGLIEGLAAIPFGPLVTVPSKWVDNYLQSHGFIGQSDIFRAVIGKSSFTTSWVEDIFFPNPVTRGIKNAVMGNFGEKGVFLSEKARIMNMIATDQFDKIYSDVERQYKTVNATQLAQYGSRDGLIHAIALKRFSEWLNNSANHDAINHQSSAYASVMLAIKVGIQYSLPTSVILSSPLAADSEIKRIANIKNPDGTKKYPSLIDQLNAYAELHPERPFDFIAGSHSGGSAVVGDLGRTFGENKPAYEWLKQNALLAKQYSQAATFLTPYVPGSPYYAPAYQLETALGLRVADSPDEYYKNMLVTIGDQVENQIYTEFRLDPKNIELGAYATPLDREYHTLLLQAKTYEERYALATDPKYATVNLNYNAMNNKQTGLKARLVAYGQSSNRSWLEVNQPGALNGGLRGEYAVNTFKQMQTMLQDTNARKAMTPDQYRFYSKVNEARQSWETTMAEAVKSNNKMEQKRLESLWYDWTSELSTSDRYAPYKAYVDSVLRKLPRTQGIGNG